MNNNQKNNATDNAANAAVTEKEAVMNNTATEQQAPVAEQAQQPVAAPVATADAGTQVPAEVPTEQVGFWQKVKTGAKKWGKRIAIGGAFIGGLFIAHKLGEAAGFDKATDAYNSKRDGDNPDPDDDPDEDDIIDDGDYTEVDE